MRGLTILAALLLTACGTAGGILPQQSTNLDVRASLGRPTDIRFDRTVAIRLADNGRLESRWDLLPARSELLGRVSDNDT